MEIVDEFKTYLEGLGYSLGIVNSLPAALNEFLEKTGKEVKEVNKEDIKRHYQYLQERPNKKRSGGLSESTISHHIYSLKLFFAWQLELGNIASNPISGLSFKTPTSSERVILNKTEIFGLYDATFTHQERAVLSVYYGCGLRRTEGELLDLKDVHFGTKRLYVRSGKGGKRRVVPMNEKVKTDLENYVLYERVNRKSETAFLCNKDGIRLKGMASNRIVKEVVRRTKIVKKVSLHVLRHSIASHLLESGLSVEYVRDFLGHKHLESTQIYTHVKSSQLWNLKTI